MFRASYYNEGGMQRLLPVGRQMVVPGQSCALDVSVMWESPPLNSQVLSGGVATLYAFYVPLRLLWSGWIDFIAQDGGAVPTTTTNWAQMFEANASGNAVTSFYRRAYKLIYNQFFGSEKFGTWYTNIETDTEVNTFLCRNLDQLAGHLVDSADAPDPTYIAAVSGAQATISLNDFRKAMKDAYSTRRADMTGDKYVDAMRRMGVALDWRVQMAPEFLGKSEVDFYPKRTRVTTETDTAKPVAYFSETMNLRVNRRFFAEHGYIVTVLLVRPHMVPMATGANPVSKFAPQDAYVNTLDEFWLGDNQTGVTPVAVGTVCNGTGTAYMPRFGYLKWGQMLAGQVSDWSTYGTMWAGFDQPTSLDTLVYGDVNFDPTPERASQIVAWSTYRSEGPTPVKITV